MTSCKRNGDGEPNGTSYLNPLVASRGYCVEFTDGVEAEYSGNINAESVYDQYEINDIHQIIMDVIVDYNNDDSVINMSYRYHIIK